MWSASSMTVTSTWPRVQAPRSSRSISRPGVATAMSRPRPQLVDLPPDGHPAVHGRHPYAQRPTEWCERLGDLAGQLPGRDEDQPRGAFSARPTGAGQPGQHRQPEREGLARAGLGPAEHAPPGERVRQGAGLDREGLLDAAGGERAHQPGRNAQLGERRWRPERAPAPRPPARGRARRTSNGQARRAGAVCSLAGAAAGGRASAAVWVRHRGELRRGSVAAS